MAPWSSTNKPITESSHKQENSSQAAKHRKQPVGRRDGRYRLDIKLPVPWSIISACVQHGSKPPRTGHSRCASRGPLITRLARHACAGDPSMHHAWLARSTMRETMCRVGWHCCSCRTVGGGSGLVRHLVIRPPACKRDLVTVHVWPLVVSPAYCRLDAVDLAPLLPMRRQFWPRASRQSHGRTSSS
jgi:hypothetical protein